MHLMDFFGLSELLHIAKSNHIIIHSLASGDKEKPESKVNFLNPFPAWKTPEDLKRESDRLKQPPGLTAMSKVNVNH